jgi:DNA-binding LytR/AlgR family response regulator
MVLAASVEEWAPRSSQARSDRCLRDPIQRIAARSGSHRIVLLELPQVWAFETRDRLAFVHSVWGRFDIDVSLTELELALRADFLRVHRNWLVAVTKVRELRRSSSELQMFIGETSSTKAAGCSCP